MALKGDMSLWILTKFAMIFFIFALALIITFFGKIQQEQSCGQSADLMAKAISSRISQVLYAPVEDERRVYKMPPAIQLGEGRARYEMNLTRIGGDIADQFMSISLRPLGMSISCGGGDQVSLAGTNVVFVDPHNVKQLQDLAGEDYLVLHPSELEDFSKKSRFLVVLKCSTKKYPPQKYLYLHDCASDEEPGCIKMSDVEGCCGWGQSPGSNPVCP
ncbi:MAG: hypothetical protein WC792_02800 [Candidatus Micrarchaeia archaeon]